MVGDPAPVNLKELLAVLHTSRTPGLILEALDGLSRRNLIEREQRPGSFTLHSVVLEYATTRLIAEVSDEIKQGQLDRLIEYRLCQAQAKEYMRLTQEQLLVIPLLAQLQSTFQKQPGVEVTLLSLLDQLRSRPQKSQGYGPRAIASN